MFLFLHPAPPSLWRCGLEQNLNKFDLQVCVASVFVCAYIVLVKLLWTCFRQHSAHQSPLLCSEARRWRPLCFLHNRHESSTFLHYAMLFHHLFTFPSGVYHMFRLGIFNGGGVMSASISSISIKVFFMLGIWLIVVVLSLPPAPQSLWWCGLWISVGHFLYHFAITIVWYNSFWLTNLQICVWFLWIRFAHIV